MKTFKREHREQLLQHGLITSANLFHKRLSLCQWLLGQQEVRPIHCFALPSTSVSSGQIPSSLLYCFIFFLTFIVYAITRLKIPLLITIFSYEMWHPTHGFFLSAPRQTTDISPASEVLQQYGLSSENTFGSLRYSAESQNQTHHPVFASLKTMIMLLVAGRCALFALPGKKCKLKTFPKVPHPTV